MLVYLSRFRKFDRNQFWVLFGCFLIKGRCFSHSCWSCSNQGKVICKWLDIIHIESDIISYRCAASLFVSVHILPTTPFLTSNGHANPLELCNRRTNADFAPSVDSSTPITTIKHSLSNKHPNRYESTPSDAHSP